MKQPAQAAPAAQRTQVEIYRVVPGKHEAFLRWIARSDEAMKAAGLPPHQLYVHEDGADWDFIILKAIGNATPEQNVARVAARKKLGLPSGARYFIEFRELIAEHTDTATEGPTTAAEWLAKLDADVKR